MFLYNIIQLDIESLYNEQIYSLDISQNYTREKQEPIKYFLS